MKQTKKGFTLVELLVVIAILAILATVSVVGYTTFITKAHISNDTAIVRQMNIALQANEPLDGKNATAYDALQDILSAGFDIEKLTPTTEGYHIVWDQNSDRIALLREDHTVEFAEGTLSAPVHLWKFVDYTENLNDGFSHYLKKADSIPMINNVTTGIDFGENTNALGCQYVGSGTAQEVIIRTNGGTLTINAPADTVRHYGTANEVVVEEIAGQSYHVFGRVTFITVNKGRVEVEQGAEIGGIHITSDQAVVTNQSGATLPTITNESEISREEAKNNAANAVAPEFGNDIEARIGMTPYASYSEAFDNAQNGDTIVCLKDLDLGTGSLFNSDSLQLTIDLNGHSVVNEAADEEGFIIRIEGTAKLNIKNGKINTAQRLVFVIGKGQIFAENCEFTTTNVYSIETNGTTTSADAVLNFKNCKITTEGGHSAVYAAAACTYTFDNCEITGGTGVLIRSGDVTLNDCTITALGYWGISNNQSDFYVNYELTQTTEILIDGIAKWTNGTGKKSTGDCVVIVDRSGSGYALSSVEITGCKFVIVSWVDNMPMGYAVRFIDIAANDCPAVTPVLENNVDANGNAIVTDSTKGGTYSFYTVDENREF